MLLIKKKVHQYDAEWKKPDNDKKGLAEKNTLLTGYIGGRAKIMGAGPTTPDNYRSGKTQTEFPEIAKLANAAGFNMKEPVNKKVPEYSDTTAVLSIIQKQTGRTSFPCHFRISKHPQDLAVLFHTMNR